MKVYHYHEVTKELLREAEAFESPLEPGVFPTPACATFVAPPALTSHQVAVWNGTAWVKNSDYRGQVHYSTADGTEIHPELGWSPDNTVTVLKPEDVSIQSWIGQIWAFDSTKALAKIRIERDARITACDYTQLSDVPFSEEKREQWAVYRQALRNFPAICDPKNPIWPTQPS
jgi:hypothetical protein